jgi:small subunit ribosomal protein S27Ae
MSLVILTEVKRKRRRKHTQLKRKINIFIKELNYFHLVFMLLTVILLLNLDKGNITQQRKTCPSCGPGTFMAQHWDRYYCGLCHTTIKMDAETVKKN